MKVVEIKENEFKDKIKGKKVVVDCYATWCGPCRMLSPIIDEVASSLEDVEFYKLDVDDAEEVSREYGIMSIPTILVFEDGKLLKKQVGFIQKEELEEFIK
ncbi:MAG: thioredoxin [Bacilli bacterium]|nr:thioredoxin [Bacilli bacterium]